MKQRDAYTRDQVADMWGVNVRTVTREIERGRLKAFRVGRCVRITQAALSEYIDCQTKEVKA